MKVILLAALLTACATTQLPKDKFAVGDCLSPGQDWLQELSVDERTAFELVQVKVDAVGTRLYLLESKDVLKENIRDMVVPKEDAEKELIVKECYFTKDKKK